MQSYKGWDFFYSLFWKKSIVLNPQTLREIRSKRFIILFWVVAILCLYYNFPYMFLGKKIGFTTDDAWIHMTYARNIFFHGKLSFDGVNSSTGTTSFLWPLILSLFSPFYPDSAVIMTHLLNSCIFFLLVCFWYQVTSSIFFDEVLAFSSAFLVPFCGNLLWHIFSGMESILFLFLGIGAIYLFGKRKYMAAGIFSALMIITRPEGLALAAAFATVEIYRTFRKNRLNTKSLLYLFSPVIIMFMIYMGINFTINDQFLTSTFRGKRWLYLDPQYVPFFTSLRYGSQNLLRIWLKHLITYSAGWGAICRVLFKGALTKEMEGIGMLFFFSGILFYLISIFKAFQNNDSLYTRPEIEKPLSFLRRNIDWKRMEIPLILWTFYHHIAYSIFLPHLGHAGRYMPMNFLWNILFFIIGLRGWGEILSFLFKNQEERIKYFLSIFFASITIIQFWYWGFNYQGCVNHINKIHINAAEWVKENIPPEEKIAAFDIGAMGFFSNREVVDIGGLIDPDCVNHLYEGSIISYIKKKKVEYIAMVHKNKKQIADNLIYRLGICQDDGSDFILTSLYKVKLERDETSHIKPAGTAYPEIQIYKINYIGK